MRVGKSTDVSQAVKPGGAVFILYRFIVFSQVQALFIEFGALYERDAVVAGIEAECAALVHAEEKGGIVAV